MCLFVLGFYFLLFILFDILIVSFFSAQDRPEVTLEEWSFLEKIFMTTMLSERSWTKLVTLDTFHWYCDGPKPSEVARCYDRQVCNRKSVAQYLLFFLAF